MIPVNVIIIVKYSDYSKYLTDILNIYKIMIVRFQKINNLIIINAVI